MRPGSSGDTSCISFSLTNCIKSCLSISVWFLACEFHFSPVLSIFSKIFFHDFQNTIKAISWLNKSSIVCPVSSRNSLDDFEMLLLSNIFSLLSRFKKSKIVNLDSFRGIEWAEFFFGALTNTTKSKNALRLIFICDFIQTRENGRTTNMAKRKNWWA